MSVLQAKPYINEVLTTGFVGTLFVGGLLWGVWSLRGAARAHASILSLLPSAIQKASDKGPPVYRGNWEGRCKQFQRVV